MFDVKTALERMAQLPREIEQVRLAEADAWLHAETVDQRLETARRQARDRSELELSQAVLDGRITGKNETERKAARVLLHHQLGLDQRPEVEELQRAQLAAGHARRCLLARRLGLETELAFLQAALSLAQSEANRISE